MNWNNYLLEKKSPSGHYAHLGVLEGVVSAPFNLLELSGDARIIDLSTPLKKFKLKYTNLSSLIGNEKIEAIRLNDIDEERLSVFSTMPNLKYLQISNNKQTEIPDLSRLKSLEVLILASIKAVQNIDFLKNMEHLKTLYIYGINNLYDLTPLDSLTSLQELCIDHGQLSGTVRSIKSIEPLKGLYELKYLCLSIGIEDAQSGFSCLYGLKKLEKLLLLPTYLTSEEMENLKNELPLLDNL